MKLVIARIIRFFFPEQIFPTNKSILLFFISSTSLITMLMTVWLLPLVYKEQNLEYTQPKTLNTILLLIFIFSLAFWGLISALEKRRKE